MEATKKQPLWWLSYVDEELEESRGVVIVRAESFLMAAAKARMLGISPGGQLKGFVAPFEYEAVLGPFEDRRLTEAAALELAEKGPES